jgi:hypothetical protein
MIAMSLCMSCGRPLPELRCGVALPRVKAAIFDAVARAGDAGISSDEISAELYVVTTPLALARAKAAIKVHVHQLNARLAGTGTAIVSEGRRRYLRRVAP